MFTAQPRIPIRDILLVGLLPSFLKCFWYRWKGYRIGKGVRFGFGSVIVGQHVDIGAGTQFGFLTILRGKRIVLGCDVQIGSMTILDTPHLELGDGTKINEQVFVGGLQGPDSRFVMGRNCQVMQMTFINPTHSIVVGDDSGIGGNCLLFGHSSWLSAFEGYPTEFDSIEIGKGVSITWRVFLLPGTRIGDGAVIGPNSLVRGDIPPRCLAMGYPARVVSREPEFPKPLSFGEKNALFRGILHEFIGFMEGHGFKSERTREMMSFSDDRRSTPWTVRVVYEVWNERNPDAAIGDADVLISLWAMPPDVRSALDASGRAWLDIERKERSDTDNDLAHELAMYFRRYGVRFSRPYWHKDADDSPPDSDAGSWLSKSA